MKKLRIVFMGTSEFAVPSLDILCKEGYNIVGVITAPDRQAGRGRKLQESEVKKYALEKGFKVLQPEKLKSPEFITQLRALKADLQVVVAFRMLPEIVWAMPPMGTINLHASLLPQYRGAAPINHAIIQGEKITGVTTFALQHEIDTGNILLQQQIKIEVEDNAGSLHDKLMQAGAETLLKTVQGLEKGSLEGQPQLKMETATKLQPAPKIYKSDGEIKWDQDAENIHNLIRGLAPYPGAYTQLNQIGIKILSAHFDKESSAITPGAFLTDHKSYLKFAARNGFIWIDNLQPEGRRPMKIAEFLRGWRG